MGVILFVLDVLWNLLLGILGNFIAADVYVWLPTLAVRLIRYEASKLPRTSERMLEEWTAHLDRIPGNVSKLWYAISLWLRHSAIVQELPAEEREGLPDENLASGNITIGIPSGGVIVSGAGITVALTGVEGRGVVGEMVPTSWMPTQLSVNVSERIRISDRNHPASMARIVEPVPFPPSTPSEANCQRGKSE